MVIIYSITSDKGPKVYIGSTKLSLSERKKVHKMVNCSSGILIDEYGWNNLVFTALEECTVEQRYEKERFYIENTLNVVNKRMPGRTTEEYNKSNREKILEQRKTRYVANREKILEQERGRRAAKKRNQE